MMGDKVAGGRITAPAPKEAATGTPPVPEAKIGLAQDGSAIRTKPRTDAERQAAAVAAAKVASGETVHDEAGAPARKGQPASAGPGKTLRGAVGAVRDSFRRAIRNVGHGTLNLMESDHPWAIAARGALRFIPGLSALVGAYDFLGGADALASRRSTRGEAIAGGVRAVSGMLVAGAGVMAIISVGAGAAMAPFFMPAFAVMAGAAVVALGADIALSRLR